MRASEDQLRAWMVDGLAGDVAAYRLLLDALVPLLRAFYRRRVRSPDDAEDLVQESLVAIHTRRATYDPGRPFTAWLFAIARYKMIDHFRRTRLLVQLPSLDEILVAEGFEDESGARLDVDRLLAELPPKQAQAIRRTRIEGLSIAEAAASGGIGESDVKVSVHRGLKTLAARIRSGRQ